MLGKYITIEKYAELYKSQYELSNHITNLINFPTPERNKLQNKFLDVNIQINLLKYLGYIKNISKLINFSNIEKLIDPIEINNFFESIFKNILKNGKIVKFETLNNWNIEFNFSSKENIEGKIKIKDSLIKKYKDIITKEFSLEKFFVKRQGELEKERNELEKIKEEDSMKMTLREKIDLFNLLEKNVQLIR